MAASDWETGSGLVLDGGTATISNVEFTFDNKISTDNPVAKFTLTDVVDSDGEEFGEDVEQNFTCGKSAVPSKDGSTLDVKKINSATKFGILIDSAKELFPYVENLVEAIPSPKEADGWVGTRWSFGRDVREVPNPGKNNEKQEVGYWVFTAYHGRPEALEVNGKKPVVKKAVAKKAVAKAAPEPAEESAEEEGETELWTYLVEMARDTEVYEDHEVFVDAALELDGVKNADKALRKAILTTDKGSIWAEAGR